MLCILLRIIYLSFNPSCPLPVFACDECHLSPKWLSVDNALSSYLSSLLFWTVSGCVLDFGNFKSLSSQMDSLETHEDISVGEGGRGRTYAKVPTQEGVADRHPNLFEECVEIHLEGVTQLINLGAVHRCILRELKSSREQVLTGNEAHKRKVEILEIQHTQKTLELALIRNELHTARTSNDAMKELLRTVQSYCALLLDEIETMKKKRVNGGTSITFPTTCEEVGD